MKRSGASAGFAARTGRVAGTKWGKTEAGAPWRRAGATRGRHVIANGAELKFHDIDWDEAAADFSAGVISNTSSLVLIGQGVTESTRVGRKAVIKSIGWRGELTLVASAAATLAAGQTVRLMVVQDKQCNGAAPAVSGANGVLTTADFQSFNELVNKGRFLVLQDKVIALNPVNGAGDGATNDTSLVKRNFTFFKTCNVPIEYSGTANPSVIGEVRTNNIFGLLIQGSADSAVSLDSKFRFRFSDG